jgi:ribosomal protein S16
MTTLKVVVADSTSKRRKTKRIEKLGQKYEKYKFD